MDPSRKQPGSRMCFVCGRRNPLGLKLDFFQDAQRGQVWSDVVIPAEFQGYPGFVHGGILATVLDEVSGRAVLLEGGDETLMATLRLTVRYRHPAPVETPLLALGWVERLSGVGARVAGEIRLQDGTVCAECEGLLGDVPQEFRERWTDEVPHWRVYD